MAGLSISHVARATGLRTSALRYYESIGLLPPPPREGGKRRYDATALHRLTLIGRARQLGFSLREIRQLTSEFPAGARWSRLAARKLEETRALLTRLEGMRDELVKIQRCSCPTIDECGKRMYQGACRKAEERDSRGRRA
jgi:MerR family redox-sensitive transcriptional activator SoxR